MTTPYWLAEAPEPIRRVELDGPPEVASRVALEDGSTVSV